MLQTQRSSTRPPQEHVKRLCEWREPHLGEGFSRSPLLSQAGEVHSGLLHTHNPSRLWKNKCPRNGCGACPPSVRAILRAIKRPRRASDTDCLSSSVGKSKSLSSTPFSLVARISPFSVRHASRIASTAETLASAFPRSRCQCSDESGNGAPSDSARTTAALLVSGAFKSRGAIVSSGSCCREVANEEKAEK